MKNKKTKTFSRVFNNINNLKLLNMVNLIKSINRTIKLSLST